MRCRPSGRRRDPPRVAASALSPVRRAVDVMQATLDADAVIVGAGIQGATMAYELARRGQRAIVVERGVPGAANTAASLGVLHGGLRYLQTLDVPRWLRSKREQAWFMRELSEFVQPLPCVMPLYRGTARSPALFRAAFAVDRCGRPFARPPGRLPGGRLLGKDAVAPGYPLVRDGLIGAAHWHELLLTAPQAAIQRLLALAAARTGARVVTGEARELVTSGDAVAGLVVGSHTGDVEIRAPVVLLCAGAGTDALARRFHAAQRRLSSATLAVNLLLDLPAPRGIALALSPTPGRGRSLFLRADAGRLLAGTWYLPRPQTAGDEAVVQVPEALVATALEELRACLPGLDVSGARVIEVRGGQLPDTDGSGRVLRERDVLVRHEAHGGPRGLWSVLGVKLTTARALSARCASAIWPHTAVRVGADQPRSLGAADHGA